MLKTPFARGINARHLIEFAAAPLFYRTLITGEMITDDDLQCIVDQAYQAFK